MKLMNDPFVFPGMKNPPAGMVELFSAYMSAQGANIAQQGASRLYGSSRLEELMGMQQEKSELLNAQMNALCCAPPPKKTCAHCGKVRRLQGDGGACADCYTKQRSRFWHILYGLGIV
jgi:hypothetical protein